MNAVFRLARKSMFVVSLLTMAQSIFSVPSKVQVPSKGFFQRLFGSKEVPVPVKKGLFESMKTSVKKHPYVIGVGVATVCMVAAIVRSGKFYEAQREAESAQRRAIMEQATAELRERLHCDDESTKKDGSSTNSEYEALSTQRAGARVSRLPNPNPTQDADNNNDDVFFPALEEVPVPRPRTGVDAWADSLADSMEACARGLCGSILKLSDRVRRWTSRPPARIRRR